MAYSVDRQSTHTVDSERRHIDDNDLTVTVRMNLDKANVPDDEVATRKDEEVGEKMSETLERISTVPTRKCYQPNFISRTWSTWERIENSYEHVIFCVL